MQRIPEVELMDGAGQARAYAEADFSEPHDRFVAAFRQRFPASLRGSVLDLGCGPADISIRFARACTACRVHGVDAAEAMLACGREAVARAGLAGRIKLLHGYLPGAVLPQARYDAVISNSLLHHLADPGVLWRAVRQHAAAQAPVFVMDLMRPAAQAQARALVDEYAQGESELLRRDFYHSLCAAYTPDEVRGQLQAAGLGYLRLEVVSDRHFIVHGHFQGEPA